MKVLILYATYSGGTLLAAEFIAETLKKNSYLVEVKNVTDSTAGDILNFDLTILGSCTWLENAKDGQLHKAFELFENRLKGKDFNGRLFAIFGLGDKNYLHFCEAVNYLQALIKETHGREIVPAMRINQYYLNEQKNKEVIDRWATNIAKNLKALPTTK